MTGHQDAAERFHPESVAEWSTWLEHNHAQCPGVWLVSWKKRTGKQTVSYEDLVTEALRFGWIDSKAKPLDEDRSMVWFGPRRRSSAWARSNKERIARLEREGRLEPAGRRAVEAAKANGAWTLLDDVEDLVVPDDLAAALAAHPGARETWDGLSPSARRQSLYWIAQAKRPETRARRVEETARLADRGERTDQRRP